LGALVGVALGYLLIPMLGRFIPESLPGKPIFMPSVALTGAAFSLTVGFLAGLLPAARAGRLHPLESVRSV
jgi:ABC-type antimicrobial peptide transport system permease subunit